MDLRISTDIGGTFTDLVCIDGKGDIQVVKVSTTSGEFADGIFTALERLAEQYGVGIGEILGRCRYFIHGSTVATNALIIRNVAKTGLILTKGHRDILTYREGGKADSFNQHEDYPEPYIPRYLTATVQERINAEGGIEIPLDEDDVRKQLNRLVEEFKVEGIAVCLLWSIMNPAHENRIGEIIDTEYPGMHYSLSHRVNPIIREYRRAVSTAIDASLFPVVNRYVNQLHSELKENGYQETLYMVTSSGALLDVEEVVKRPIYTIGSGPTMAPRAGLMYSAMEDISKGKLITCDMGGTSFDVSIATDGKIRTSRETREGDDIIAIMKADVRSIGSGGGSIAWIDSGGMPKVGPRSAGAIPGPACYMRGGKEPTVTDANVVLGYLDPDYFLGGQMTIDPKRSEQVIREKIADPLGLDVLEAAYTIWTTINHDMVAAIEDITIWQGVDPREYLLVAGGGAAGLHIAHIARELKMKKIIVPKLSGVLSAFGGLAADMTMDFHASHFADSKQFDYDGVNEILADLQRQAEKFLSGTGVVTEKTTILFSVEARYAYQVWELNIPIIGNRIADKNALSLLVDGFHRAHEDVFGIREAGQVIEFVNWGAQAIAKVPKMELKALKQNQGQSSNAQVTQRKAYFHELGTMVDTPVYRGDKLFSGARIEGPAIIQEPTSTLVVFNGCTAVVSPWGNYLIELD